MNKWVILNKFNRALDDKNLNPYQPQQSLGLSTIPGKSPVEATAKCSRSTVAPDLQEYTQQKVQAQIQANNATLLQGMFKMMQNFLAPKPKQDSPPPPPPPPSY